MFKKETREQKATNIAIWRVFHFGYRAGIVFQKQYGPEAEKMFIGGQHDEGDSGKSHLYTRPLRDTDIEEISGLFQRTRETAWQNLEKYEGQDDCEDMAKSDTWTAFLEDPYVKQLLESKSLSYG